MFGRPANPLRACRPGAVTRAAALAALALASAACDPDPNGAGSGDDESGALTQLDLRVPANYVERKSRSLDGAQVTLKCPPTWKTTGTSGTVVLNLQTDRPGSSVNVVVVPAATGETLNRTMASLPEQLENEFANFEHLGTDYLVFNDTPAGRIVYEATRSGFHGKLMQVFVLKAGRTYVLTYTAAPDDFAGEYPAVERVLASMVVK